MKMTIKKAYINLTFALILIVLTIVLGILKVSGLIMNWTIVMFILTAIIALTSGLVNILLFKKNSEYITDNYLKKHQFIIIDWLSFFSLSMMFIMFLFMFVIGSTSVTGSSMSPTLKQNERVLMYHFDYQPKRNDVIIVHITDRYINTMGDQVNLDYPDPTAVFYVKRIAAIPGDVIAFLEIGESNIYQIYINGEVYQNQYAQIYEVNQSKRLKMLSCLDENNQLRADQYFAFGDNQQGSFDSREIGAIYKGDIIGKAIYKLWPLGGIANE